MDKNIRISNLAQEIAWLEKQIKEQILSTKNIKEYRLQIRRKGIVIAYLRESTN